MVCNKAVLQSFRFCLLQINGQIRRGLFSSPVMMSASMTALVTATPMPPAGMSMPAADMAMLPCMRAKTIVPMRVSVTAIVISKSTQIALTGIIRHLITVAAVYRTTVIACSTVIGCSHTACQKNGGGNNKGD